MRLTKTEKRTIVFLTLLLVITVGYALLSQTLDINGISSFLVYNSFFSASFSSVFSLTIALTSGIFISFYFS